MTQLSHDLFLNPALEGMLADIGVSDKVSAGVLKTAAVAQQDTVTVDTADDTETYTVTINGVPVAIVAADNDQDNVRDQIVSAINGDQFASAFVTAAPTGGTGVLTLDAVEAGVGYTVAVNATGGGAISTANVVANVEASLPVEFGRGVAVNSPLGDLNAGVGNVCKNLDAASTLADFLGVAVHTHRQPNLRKETDAQLRSDAGASYRPGDSASVIRRGRIWVVVEGTAVTTQSGVYVRKVATAGTTLGRFSSVDDPGNVIDLSAVAQWATGVQTVPGLAVLNLNLPSA